MDSKKKNKTHHSFYKEANKSILGQQQLTPKKVAKLSFKAIKWLMFAFLIVATLWGCVNEFIIKTSHNLGQGVEFYRNDDFVYPNMYTSSEIIGYTIASNEVTEGVNGKGDYFDEGNLKNETIPFNFYTINPNYNLVLDDYDFEDVDQAAKDLNVDNYVIKAEDVKTIEQKRKKKDKVIDQPEVYSYNLNEASVILTNLFSYNINQIIKPDNKGIMTPSSAIVPSSVKTDLNKKIEDQALEKDKTYKVDGWVSFVFYIYDSSDGNLDGTISNELPKGNWMGSDDEKYNADFFNLIDGEDLDITDGIQKKEVVGLNGTLALNEPTKFSPKDLGDVTNINNWQPIYSIPPKIPDEEDEDKSVVNINGQIIEEINNKAFLNGTGKSNYNDLINNNDSLKEAIESYGEDVTSAAKDYSVDYLSLNIIPKEGKVYGGSESVVTPLKKGFPIKPSDHAIELLEGDEGSNNGYRNNNFESTKLTSNQDKGFDSTIQNFGWMLMDKDGDLQRVYDNEDDAFNKDPLTLSDEDDAFYADQRRLGWGQLDYNEVGKIDNSKSVFDEKIKGFMAHGDDKDVSKYVSLNRKSIIRNKDDKDAIIEYNQVSKFAGMTSALEVQNFKKDYRGVLPKYVKQSDNDYWETSILSDSILPTGQDSWNETRVAFQGWGDWGKAWDVNKFGLLYGAFVFPISQFAMGIGELFNYQISPWGTVFSIFIIVFLVRGLGALLSMKGTKNQSKMQEVQTDVAKIKAKYSKYDLKEDKKMKQKQQMEIMALYKKNEVNPMGSLGTIFVTMPIFISLWIIISALPAYKIAVMGNFSFSVSAWYGMFNLGLMFFLYLFVGITVGLVQGVSSKLPNWLANKRKGVKRIDEATKKSMKKQNRTQNIMVGVFIFMGLTVPAMFAIYWIASGLFTIFLELGRHLLKTRKANKVKEQ